MTRLSSLLPQRALLRSTLVGVIAFTLGAATVAAAVVGNLTTDTLYPACVSAGSGSVRIVADGEPCKTNETAIVLPAKGYVDAETLARQAADTTLQSNLDAEAAARAAADTTLQTNLNAEAAARAAADTTLQNNVNAEAAARQAADATLQANINAEAAARAAGDAATLAAANAYTDAHSGAALTAGTGILISSSNVISADFSAFDSRYYAKGSLGVQVVSTTLVNGAQLLPGATLTAQVTCPVGKVVISGGANSSTGSLVLFQSYPSTTVRWTANARAIETLDAFTATLSVYAVCAAF
jgi:hypothetical protein